MAGSRCRHPQICRISMATYTPLHSLSPRPLLLLFLFLAAINGQTVCPIDRGCFPPLGNLAAGRPITASSTCTPDTEFCIFGTATCANCSNAHTPSSINDRNDGTVWVSEIGSSDNMSLRLDLEAPVLFEGMNLLWASPRPSSMMLERSSDFGAMWSVYRYYSSDCRASFMMESTEVLPGTVLASMAPVCTGMESTVNPTTGGTVTFSTAQHLPSDTPMSVSNDYQLITNLRVTFLTRFPSVESSATTQYYAVAEWSVEGRCMCNGHASVCIPAPGEDSSIDKEVYTGCACQHSTMGLHCNQCVAGFNAREWAAGTANNSNSCLECMCNGHAPDCSPTPPFCNCSDNTTGDSCEQCRDSYYSDNTLMLNDPDICLLCECEAAGIIDTGLCNGLGQCNCKANVDPGSDKCSICQDGYWNLTAENQDGCQLCDCDAGGTESVGSGTLLTCIKETGLCVCRENVVGERCDRCADGYYDFASGCRSCDCNVAGSVNGSCDQDSPNGQCPCRPNIVSTTCDTPLPGYFFRRLDDTLFEAEEAVFSSDITTVLPLAGSTPVPFTGSGLISLPPMGVGHRVTFNVTPPTTLDYELIIRYQASSPVDGISVTIPILSSFSLISLSESVYYDSVTTLTLEEGVFYEVLLEYTPFTSTESWLLDSLLLLPDFSSASQYYAQQVAADPANMALIEGCLPRGTATPNDPLCFDVAFALSVESSGQVFECPVGCSGGMTSPGDGGLQPIGPGGCPEQVPLLYSLGECSGEADCEPQCVETCPRSTDITPFYGNHTAGACQPLLTQDSTGAPFSARLNATQYTGAVSTDTELGARVADFSVIINKAAFAVVQSVVLSAVRNDQAESVLKILLPDGSVANSGTVTALANFSDPGSFYYLDLAIVLTAQPPLGVAVLGLDLTVVVVGMSTTGFISAESQALLNVTVVAPLEPTCTSAIVGGSTCQQNGGGFTCLPGVGGDLCDSCLNGWFNFNSTTGCTACGCSTDGSLTSVCDPTTGQCPCRPGVGGRACDTCLPDFFNLTSLGCAPCSCSAFSVSTDCDATGQCSCPQGIEGRTCSQCSDRFYNITATGCLPCGCDSIGSASDICDRTSGQCSCIEGSIGRDCSLCPLGFFSTDGSVRDRCIQCQCSGRSLDCTQDDSDNALGEIASEFTNLCAQFPINCSDGWQLLTERGSVAAPYGPNDGSGLAYILLSNSNPQLVAPLKFLSNRQASYGLLFSFTVIFNVAGTALNENLTLVQLSGSLLSEPLVSVLPPPTIVPDGTSSEAFLTYSTPLVEDSWRVGSSSGPQASYFQLLSVLTNVTRLSFSAEFSEDFIEFVHVTKISLQTILPTANLNSSMDDITPISSPFPVESCTCPEAYTGQFCQECARGFARFSEDPVDPCVRCNCNNLTLDCDVLTGSCLNCSENSEGDNCQQCMIGYYGNPVLGVACLPCMCPTLNQSFSPSCFLAGDGLPTCDACEVGYSGRTCDLCSNGFFGNPFNGRCTTCECNENTDPSLGPTCDMGTGQCLNCRNNTMGFECELCLPDYYGDPTNDPPIPCQPCNCNPNGTAGVCSSIDGACTCRANVRGDTCDECEDGYWGLSQGLGCIPCDCCDNGSLSGVCDKDTGRCECLTNVGSDVDDKCCTCTPGFFNFSTSGCQACGCSSLSTSVECNAASGQCACQDEAIGLKCDDCAFGYTGQVPACERCHECFFQWFDILSNLSASVSSLGARLRIAVDVNYNGFSVADIEASVGSLLAQLAAANQTLSNIDVQSLDLSALNQTLNELTRSLAELNATVAEVERELDVSERMLNRASSFDGTLNGTTIQDLERQALDMNATAASLAQQARTALASLLMNQTTVNVTWGLVENMSSSVEGLLQRIRQAGVAIELAEEIVTEYQASFGALRSNLTYVDMRAQYLGGELNRLTGLAYNASSDVDAANTSLQVLRSEVEQRSDLIGSLQALADQLNATALTLRLASQETLDSATAVQAAALRSTRNVNETIANVISTLSTLESTFTNLSLARNLSTEILSTSLPSVESVVELARQINETVVSEEDVEAVRGRARESRMAAEEALALAANASNVVGVAQSLVAGLESDLNCSRSAIERLQSSAPSVEQLLIQSQANLQEVASGTSTVNTTVAQIKSTAAATRGVISDADSVGMDNRQSANDLEADASDLAARSRQYVGVTEGAVGNHTLLREAIGSAAAEAEAVLAEAQAVEQQAQRTNTTAHQVSLEELEDLLEQYSQDQAAIAALSQQADSLESELDDLIVTFTDAERRLQQCYKTP